MRARERAWEILQPAGEGDAWSRRFDISIGVAILVAIASVVLGSIPSLERSHHDAFIFVEIVTLIIFVPEYLVRLWACRESPKYSRPFGRLRWVLSISALVDLAAIVPAIVTLGAVDLRALRALRLLRLFRIGKYSRGMRLFMSVLNESRHQLVISLSAILVLLLMASSVLYLAERDMQPEVFGSIPAAMWWGVTALTTVGYGDAVPATDLGRVLASMVAILGIGTFALPAGIIAGAFDRVLARDPTLGQTCPDCGASLHVGANGRRG